MDKNKKIIIIGGIAFILVVMIASAIYLLLQDNSTNPDYQTDSITGQTYLHDAPTSDGTEDSGPTIAGQMELTKRGMTLDQLEYFREQTLAAVEEASLKHDQALRIETNSITRSSSDGGIKTSFNLYLTDSDYIVMELFNKYSELNKVQITAKKTDGTTVFKK